MSNAEQAEQPRKQLKLGSRPRLGLSKSGSKPAESKADATPVATRRKKKVVVHNTKKPRPKPGFKPKPKLTPEQIERKLVIEARQKQDRLAKEWLLKKFPVVFNEKDPKPMALNTANLLGVLLKAEGGAAVTGFGWNSLKRVVKRWVSNERYLRAVAAKDAVRYNIVTGQPATDGEVIEQHQKNARKNAQQARSKRLAKQQGKKSYPNKKQGGQKSKAGTKPAKPEQAK